MNALELLMQECAVSPQMHDLLSFLYWDLRDDFGLANLALMGKDELVADPDHPGKQILKATLGPPALPLINALFTSGYERGWRRSDEPHSGAYVVYAFLKREGAEIRIAGVAFERERPHPEANSAIPFFAPPVPRRSSKKFLEQYREWEGKCLRGEW